MNRANLTKTLLPLAILLAGGVGAWAIVEHRPTVESVLPPEAPPKATVVRVEPQTLRVNVASQGVAKPREEIDWVSEVAGKVIRISPNFVAGGFFAAGEELVAIDPRDYDLAIAAAQARIAEARRRLAQEEAHAEQARSEWQALGEGQPTPLTLHEPQLAEARALLKAAEADLAKAKLQRSRCRLRAPFAGRALNRQAGLGQYVQAGEKLARIYSTDAAEIRLPVSADRLAYLELDIGRPDGKPATGPKVTLAAELGGVERRWEGRIVRSEGGIDEATGMLHLVAEVREPYSRERPQPLLAGLFVKAEIEGRMQNDLFVLPQGAVNAAQEATAVDAEQRLRIRRVEVLRNEPDRILARGGLSAGDRVVVSGIQIPIEGMKVRVETSERDIGGGEKTGDFGRKPGGS